MKKYETSNENYTLNFAQTQSEILNQEQDIIPQSIFNEKQEQVKLFFGPKRNIHTHSTLKV